MKRHNWLRKKENLTVFEFGPRNDLWTINKRYILPIQRLIHLKHRSYPLCNGSHIWYYFSFLNLIWGSETTKPEPLIGKQIFRRKNRAVTLTYLEILTMKVARQINRVDFLIIRVGKLINIGKINWRFKERGNGTSK